MSRRLPIAPRPFPDEGLSSWVFRFAARYRLAPEELLDGLVPGRQWRAFEVRRLDTIADVQVESALARAARLPAGMVSHLRSTGTVWSRRLAGWPLPHVWCQACVQDDLNAYGETYDRSVWAFGGFILCPRHRRALAWRCPSCRMPACRAVAHDGRRRLQCAECRTLVDGVRQQPEEKAAWPYGLGATSRIVVADRPVSIQETAIDMLLELQATLLAAANGGSAMSSLAFGLAPDLFMGLADKLAVLAVASIGWDRREEFLLDQYGHLQPDSLDRWNPGMLSMRGAAWVLAIMGALLCEMAGRPRSDVIWKGCRPISNDQPVHLAGLMTHAGASEDELRRLLKDLPERNVGCLFPARTAHDSRLGHHREWARRILADPAHALELRNLRGAGKGKALGRMARAQILRLEAGLPNHSRA